MSNVTKRSGQWFCTDCDENFRRGDGSHCPDCGECGENRGHMECQYPSDDES